VKSTKGAVRRNLWRVGCGKFKQPAASNETIGVRCCGAVWRLVSCVARTFETQHREHHSDSGILEKPNMMTQAQQPPRSVTFLWAIGYVLSGICQPLIMTLCKEAGLADSSAQLYMFFYYLGPAVLLVTLLVGDHHPHPPHYHAQHSSMNQKSPSAAVIGQASGIALYDLLAQSINYTGAGLAGPTVFAIIYSSVTIWTAVFSRLVLGRSITTGQWMAIWVVFLGLALTGMDSIQIGPSVVRGTLLVAVGSMMHGSAYVWNEAIMTTAWQPLSVRQNAAIQGTVACVVLGLWQLVYTRARFGVLIGQPAQQAGTTLGMAIWIMLGFAVANLVHSVAFSHTLKYYPGGATSAGVMKGLQAVLVFVAAWMLYCGRVGGSEMCFSTAKVASLLTVSGGVVVFSILTRGGKDAGDYEPIADKVGDDLLLEDELAAAAAEKV